MSHPKLFQTFFSFLSSNNNTKEGALWDKVWLRWGFPVKWQKTCLEKNSQTRLKVLQRKGPFEWNEAFAVKRQKTCLKTRDRNNQNDFLGLAMKKQPSKGKSFPLVGFRTKPPKKTSPPLGCLSASYCLLPFDQSPEPNCFKTWEANFAKFNFNLIDDMSVNVD